MRKWMQVLLVCLAVCLGTGFGEAERAEAASKVVWTTTDLYYELDGQGSPKDVLVIEGYFTNHTDKYINYIYELNLSATMRADIGAGYTGTVNGTFRNFEKMIDPHSDASHKFRITKAKIVWPIEEYEVTQGYTKWKQSDLQAEIPRANKSKYGG